MFIKNMNQIEIYSLVKNLAFIRVLYGIAVYFVEIYAGLGLYSHEEKLITTKKINPMSKNTTGNVKVASKYSIKGAATNFPNPKLQILNPLKKPL